MPLNNNSRRVTAFVLVGWLLLEVGLVVSLRTLGWIGTGKRDKTHHLHARHTFAVASWSSPARKEPFSLRTAFSNDVCCSGRSLYVRFRNAANRLPVSSDGDQTTRRCKRDPK